MKKKKKSNLLSLSRLSVESKNAFPAVLSTEGRVVELCWEKLELKGPNGSRSLPQILGVMWICIGTLFAAMFSAAITSSLGSAAVPPRSHTII